MNSWMNESKSLAGKVLKSNGYIEDLCITYNEKILDISKNCRNPEEMPPKTLIIPGGIDLHVHVRGSELSYKETIETASAEAAYGGITVFFDMPNTVPPVNTVNRIFERLEEFSGRSLIDYGIYSGIPKNVYEVSNIDKLPVAGFKIYPEDLDRFDVLEHVYRSRKLKVLHPEIPIALKIQRSLRVQATWLETASLYLVRGRVHVTHITSYSTLTIAKKMNFTTDVTPHHMLLDIESTCLDKVNPPIRDLIDRSLIWKALNSVDCVASDHAPHTFKEKMQNMDICPPGVALVSFTLPFIYSLALKGIISFRRALELTALNPSRVLGLSNVGLLKPGYRADIAIINFDDWRYSTRYSKATYTPLDGFRLNVKVIRSIVGGETIYSEGEIYSKPVGVNIID